MKIKAENKLDGVVLEMDIPTNSRKEALEQLLRRHPHSSILAIEGRSYIGRCESTGHPIFEGDNYQEDADGIIWLNYPKP